MSDNERVGHYREHPADLLAIYQEQLPGAMGEKMSVGQRRWGDSWVDSHPDYMLRRMEEEFYEFRQQLEHKGGSISAVEEMADVVNYGLMALALARSADTGSSQNASNQESSHD